MTTPPPIDASDRVAIIGIGSALRGDDAVGIELLRQLEERVPEGAGDQLLFVEGGVAPENHTGVVRRFDPDWIVLLDAVDFNGEPGSGKWVDPDDLGGESFSSHKSTPAMLRTFLEREMDAKVALFGVQPAQVDRRDRLSSTVQKQLDELAERVADAIGVDR